jgi:hypothetical protein
LKSPKNLEALNDPTPRAASKPGKLESSRNGLPWLTARIKNSRRIIFNPDEKGSTSKDASPVHPEAYFQDWLANLRTEASDEGDDLAEVESEAGAALKNKKRAQRKSQNLKKKRH